MEYLLEILHINKLNEVLQVQREASILSFFLTKKNQSLKQP